MGFFAVRVGKELLNHCVRPPFEDMMKAAEGLYIGFRV